MSWEHVHLVHPRASASSLSKNRFQLRTFSIIWPNIPRQGQRYHEPSNTSSLKEQFISKAEAGLAALSFPSGDLLIKRYWTCSPSFQFCFIIFHPCHALDPLTIFNHSCIEITSLGKRRDLGRCCKGRVALDEFVMVLARIPIHINPLLRTSRDQCNLDMNKR